jgi:hypothetical protein
MASKSYHDGIEYPEEPVLDCVQLRKEWRVLKRSDGKWANCEIILEVNRNGEEKLTVIKDGIRVSSWPKKGFSIKPPK